MGTKTIPQLTTGVLNVGSLFEFDNNDAAGSKKCNLSALAAAFMPEALDIVTTGGSIENCVIPVFQRAGIFQFGDEVISASGKWTDGFKINSALLETITFSDLVGVVKDIDIQANTALTSIGFTTLVGAFNLLMSNPLLQTFSAPALKTVNGLGITDTTLATINISNLAYVGYDGLILPRNALTNLNVSSLESVNYNLNAGSNSSLVSINLGTSLRQLGGFFAADGCALNQASVDAVLVALAALNGTGDTIAYSGKAVYLDGGTNAVPSATGLTAKATLEGRGNTVSVNS